MKNHDHDLARHVNSLRRVIADRSSERRTKARQVAADALELAEGLLAGGPVFLGQRWLGAEEDTPRLALRHLEEDDRRDLANALLALAYRELKSIGEQWGARFEGEVEPAPPRPSSVLEVLRERRAHLESLKAEASGGEAQMEGYRLVEAFLDVIEDELTSSQPGDHVREAAASVLDEWGVADEPWANDAPLGLLSALDTLSGVLNDPMWRRAPLGDPEEPPGPPNPEQYPDLCMEGDHGPA